MTDKTGQKFGEYGVITSNRTYQHLTVSSVADRMGLRQSEKNLLRKVECGILLQIFRNRDKLSLSYLTEHYFSMHRKVRKPENYFNSHITAQCQNEMLRTGQHSGKKISAVSSLALPHLVPHCSGDSSALRSTLHTVTGFLDICSTLSHDLLFYLFFVFFITSSKTWSITIFHVSLYPCNNT